MGRASTSYLLTCAAIGVATALLLIPATAFSVLTYATLPPVSALVTGAWVIGFVVAMRLLERPGAAVVTGLISGLVTAPLSASGPAIIITNVMFAAVVELPFLVTAYRRWGRGLYYGAAVALTVVYGAWTMTAADMQAFPWWVLALYAAALLASSLAGVALGIVVADGLRRAGVARLARRPPQSRSVNRTATDAGLTQRDPAS